MLRRLARLAPLLAPVLLLAACAGREDTSIEELPFAPAESALAYEAALADAPTEEVADLARRSLRIFRRQEDGANSVPLLRRRAETDIETAKKILKSFGWFEGDAEVEVTVPDQAALEAYKKALAEYEAARAAEGPRTGRDGAAAPPAAERPEHPEARVTLRFIPGPRYTLSAHQFVLIDTGKAGAPEMLSAEALGAPVGGPAAAREIIGAEAAALKRLKADGRPWATRRGRRAVADPAAKTIAVETIIATGPAAVYGDVSYSGAPSVDAAHLRSYQTFAPGQKATPADLKKLQQELSRTDLFDSVSVLLPETPPEDAETTPEGAVIAPVSVSMEESEPRTVSAGLRFSTSAGPEIRLGFIHRNLFNAGERLELELEGGQTEQTFSAVFRKPQFLRPGQEFGLALELFNEEGDAFASTGVELAAGVTRKLSDRVTVGFGALAEVAETEQNGPRRSVLLGGLPAFADYDGSDDKLDPKEGFRARLAVTPFLSSIDGDLAPFLLLDGTASGYVPLDENRRYVLAGRVRLASILASELGDVPPNRRLYAGGGGSVRGFGADLIGPLDGDYAPTGGRSAVELGTEFRFPVWGPVGAAVFAEAGMVGEDGILSLEEDLLVAAGLGLRFASPAGPFRLDVGVPLNPRDADEPLQIYISIGQAW